MANVVLADLGYGVGRSDRRSGAPVRGDFYALLLVMGKLCLGLIHVMRNLAWPHSSAGKGSLLGERPYHAADAALGSKSQKHWLLLALIESKRDVVLVSGIHPVETSVLAVLTVAARIFHTRSLVPKSDPGMTRGL